jgi:uncharacterized membrane protein YccF (DUF307 family)
MQPQPPQDPRTGQFYQPPNSTPGNPWQQPPPNAMPGGPWQQQPPPNAMYPGQQPMYQPHSYAQTGAINVNISAPQTGANGCVRILYFFFIGWWLSLWCLEIGFALCFFIITLPLGLLLLNRIPQIMTLKPSKKVVQTNVSLASGAGGNVVNVNMNVQGTQQYPFLLRAVYYIFIGSWVGFLWAQLGYLLCLSLLGLPLGVLMLDLLPAVLTLRRN